MQISQGFPAQGLRRIRSSSAQHRGPGAERRLNPPFLVTPAPLPWAQGERTLTKMISRRVELSVQYCSS
jgi:hypothetical protein